MLKNTKTQKKTKCHCGNTAVSNMNICESCQKFRRGLTYYLSFKANYDHMQQAMDDARNENGYY